MSITLEIVHFATNGNGPFWNKLTMEIGGFEQNINFHIEFKGGNSTFCQKIFTPFDLSCFFTYISMYNSFFLKMEIGSFGK